MKDLRFPVGRFIMEKEQLSDEQRFVLIDEIKDAPAQIHAAVRGLTDDQLDTPYRPGGWTARQVVHHLADSHLNGYTRFRLALIEQNPTIKPYEEARWAELDDARRAPPEVSLNLLESLHQRWILLLRSLKPDDFSRSFDHPDHGLVTLENALGLYAWHGRHHTAHITELRRREGWM